MPDTPLIEARQIRKLFRQSGVDVPALRGVDLRIDPGDFVVIAGPSGSGKSTLLNILGLLDSPTAGRLWHDGRELSGLSRREMARLRRDKLGFVFQAYNLMPVLTALENTEMVMEFQGIGAEARRKRARDVLDRLGLAAEMDRYPGQLSGGQQQRVAVARAIAGGPRVVIADEPTANLDSTTTVSLMDLLVSLNVEDGTSFIFSSHDPLVIDRARRVIRLRDGQIEATAAAGAVQPSPATSRHSVTVDG